MLYPTIRSAVAISATARQVAGDMQMKFGWLFVLLPLVLSHASFGQSNLSAPARTQIAVTQAMREGRVADAEKLLTDAIRDLEQSDPQSTQLANFLNQLSGFLERRGRHAEALALAERASEIERNAYGPSDLRRTIALRGDATRAQAGGNNQEAELQLNQALEIVRVNETNLKSSMNIDLAAGVYGSAANFYINQHRWVDAENMIREETKLCKAFPEPFRAGYADCGSLNEMWAQVYRGEGRTSDAEQLSPDRFGPPELEALNKNAEKYEKDGLYPSAEDAYNRAIILAGKIEADPQNRYGGLIVRETNLLGQLFETEGLNDRAERAYLSAFEANEKLAGPERGHTAHAVTLDPRFLLGLYRKEGRSKDAESLLQRVLAVQERSLGERHRSVVQTLTTLAGMYEQEGKTDNAKYAQALPLYERIVAIQEVNLGPDHPDLLQPLGHYADLLLKLHQDAKAADVRARMNRISIAKQNARK
jgi:Tetratricopeptide repeat